MATPELAAVDEFRQLFDAEVGYVWQTLRRLGIPSSDVEDVASGVWVTVYRRLGDFDRARPIRPWLFGIVFRIAAAHRRLAYHRREILDGDRHANDLAADAPAPDEQLSARDAHHLVLAALEAIEPDRRAIFVMHDMDGIAMKEIAGTLDVGVNTAYSRLRLARDEFKAAVTRLRLRKGPS